MLMSESRDSYVIEPNDKQHNQSILLGGAVAIEGSYSGIAKRKRRWRAIADWHRQKADRDADGGI